ncbi:MAG: hypothetical protein ACTHOH_16445 [Lysobacteraceae bacterium]
MSVDPLSPLSAQLARLRAELAERNGKPRKKNPVEESEDVASESATDESARVRPDARALRSTVADIVRNAKSDGVTEKNAVRSRVVKAILLWEFGPTLREHPEWQSMVETIIRVVDSDERISDAFNRMIDEFSGYKFNNKPR